MKSNANVIFKLNAFSNKKSNSRAYYETGKYIDYITRKEAVSNDGTTHLINLNTLEMYSPEQYLELREQLKNLNEKQLIWDAVISLYKDFADKNGIGNEKAFAEAIQKPLEKLFEKNKMDINRFVIFGAMHHNTDHPHMHIGFFEKEPLHMSKNNNPVYTQWGSIGGKDVLNFKEFGSDVEKFVENDILYKSLREYRQQLCEKASDKFKNEYVDDFGKLISYFVEKDIHKFQYNKLDTEAQNKVMDVVNSLIKNDEELSSTYQSLKNVLIDIHDLHEKRNDAYKLEEVHSEDLEDWLKLETDNIDVRVANSVLKTIKPNVLDEFDNQISDDGHRDSENDNQNDEDSKQDLKKELAEAVLKTVETVIKNDVETRVKENKYRKFNLKPNKTPVVHKAVKNSRAYSSFNLDKLRAERELKYFLKKAMQKTLNDALNIYEKMEEELFEKSKAKSYER